MTRIMNSTTFNPNTTIPHGGKLIAISDIRPIRSNQSKIVPGMAVTGKGVQLERKNKETFRHRNGYSQIDGITHFSGEFGRRKTKYSSTRYFIPYSDETWLRERAIETEVNTSYNHDNIERDLQLEFDKRAFADEELESGENLRRNIIPETTHNNVYDYFFDRHLRTIMNLPTVTEEPEEEEKEAENGIENEQEEEEESESIGESEKLSIIGENLVKESIDNIIHIFDEKPVPKITLKSHL